MDKLRNFWYYYKTHLLIALAVVLVAGYFTVQRIMTPEPDYHIGLIRAMPLPDADLDALNASFATAGKDRNGDGQVLVQIHTFYVDLADQDENAGVNNAQVVAGLDADLVGGVSGIFLTEDPQTLQAITGEIFTDAGVSYGYDLYLCIRSDAPEDYRQLAEAAAP